MTSFHESWVFKVKEEGRDEFFLCPEPQEDPQPLLRGNVPQGLLQGWGIRFRLPKGIEIDDAKRLAELLNEYVNAVHCTRLE